MRELFLQRNSDASATCTYIQDRKSIRMSGGRLRYKDLRIMSWYKNISSDFKIAPVEFLTAKDVLQWFTSGSA